MGIPTDIFVTPPDTNLVCVICHDVFDDPVSLQSCGHTFCRSCISQVPGSLCPTCRHDSGGQHHGSPSLSLAAGATTTGHQYAPNLVARGMVSELQIRCKLDHQYRHPGMVITGAGGSGGSHHHSASHASLLPRGKRLRLERSSTDGDDVSSTGGTGSKSANPTVTGCSDGCNWIGKVSEWTAHTQRECPLHTVTCSVVGCSYSCPRKDMQQHQIDYMNVHCNLIVDSKLLLLESKLTRQRSEYEVQLHQLETKSKMDLIHYHLTNICRQWCQHRPKALQDFLLCRPRIVYYPYTTEPHARMNKLLCGIPGPKNTAWEGGILPLLLTWSDVHRPPICQFPTGFYHANVYKATGAIVTTMYREKQWHAEITLPEILFNIQQLLAHPKKQSSASSPNSASKVPRGTSSPVPTPTNAAVANHSTSPTGHSRMSTSPSPLQHHPIFPTQNQQQQQESNGTAAAAAPTTAAATYSMDAYHTFIMNYDMYNDKIRTMVKDKYSYSDADEFLTKGIASPEVRRFIGNPTNWRLVDGCRTTWKRDWQTFDAYNDSNDSNGDEVDQQAPSPLSSPSMPEGKCVNAIADSSGTDDAAASKEGSTKTTPTMPCPCSCCKLGSSFWDERHEMRFFFGSGL